MAELRGAAEREWPNGRVSGDDDGETAYMIAADMTHKIVRIQFTKPMQWVGLDVASARLLASMLNAKADIIEATDRLAAARADGLRMGMARQLNAVLDSVNGPTPDGVKEEEEKLEREMDTLDEERQRFMNLEFDGS
jgi:hypothetical protein